MPISLNGNGQVTGVSAFDIPTLIIDETNNRVGIGTTTPISSLQVVGGEIKTTTTGGNEITLGLDGNIEIARVSDGAYIDFKSSTSEDYDTRIQQVSNGLAFSTGGSGAPAERMRIDSDGKTIINGTALNSGPARLELRSQADSTSFYNKEVFRVSVNTAAEEITRLTLSGANGFRAYFKVIVTGHTGTQGNGINIKEYYWNAGTSAPVQISTYTQSDNPQSLPVISFDNSTNNVCVIRLNSGHVGGFQGTMMVEWIMPRDFIGSTGTIS